jgi:methylamine dehydrogenase accessory protein MauD
MSALAISNIVLWVIVIALLFVVLALTRQLGVLHERIAPVGALMLGKGLTVGEKAPMVEASDLDGHALRIGAPRTDNRSTLVLFVSPTCPICKTLLPVVRSSRKDERDWLEILLASDGDAAGHRELLNSNGLAGVPYILSSTLGMTYQVSRLPFAVLIDSGGIVRARGLVNSREQLESLFEAQRLGVASIQEYFASKAQSA